MRGSEVKDDNNPEMTSFAAPMSARHCKHSRRPLVKMMMVSLATNRRRSCVLFCRRLSAELILQLTCRAVVHVRYR
jgi:hypothetical protein